MPPPAVWRSSRPIAAELQRYRPWPRIHDPSPLSCARYCAGALLAACAGNGEGLDANGQPLVPGGSAPPPLSADFESIQENIFTPICSVCHAGATAPEGLRLDAADSYNLLVGVPSTEVPSLDRVKPGDPTDSYIIQKLQGHAAVGAQMPDRMSHDATLFVGEHDRLHSTMDHERRPARRRGHGRRDGKHRIRRDLDRTG